MTLLLGPPQSGKSTVLKALSGRLHPSGLSIQGNVISAAPSLTSLSCLRPRMPASSCFQLVSLKFGQFRRTVRVSAGCCPMPRWPLADAYCLFRHR